MPQMPRTAARKERGAEVVSKARMAGWGEGLAWVDVGREGGDVRGPWLRP